MNRLAGRLGVPLSLFALVAVVATIVYAVSPNSLQQAVIVILINIVLVVGLYVFTGNSGVYSFGQLAFAMLGAYVGGLLVMPTALKQVQVPNAPEFLRSVTFVPAAAVLIAGLVAVLVAIPIAVPLSRIGGLSAGLATVAMLISMNVVASEWSDLTRGRRGLSSIPTTTTLTWALVWVLVALVVAGVHQTSSSGRQLRASRDDEVAAAASGVWISLRRGQAFILSAFLNGVGGALFGMFLGSVSPSVFYLDYTFIVIAMLVVGGARSLSGAVFGAVVVGVLQEFLRRVEDGSLLGLDVPSRPGLANVALGVLLVAMLLRRPHGLTGGRELCWWRQRAA
ncbi:putative High-affinity branched-chain amino acid transport system permease protein livM [Nostocoides australiense Ben110]|uniref:Putative High-affinity branched-chain amino acid transport system permease protein livM n=1 Tax=Nostocoides australiense Ben110 TaxID=1193182 RepID=W6K1J3_9MICO|nr:branched-chain amino acid ABC transporter permease [Tetrasphaera australiensis]CCH74875.1 putative High-affinity branched-chain amino acid transport system permease protein livM [Tetrasphaera australiensis Ben110]